MNGNYWKRRQCAVDERDDSEYIRVLFIDIKIIPIIIKLLLINEWNN